MRVRPLPCTIVALAALMGVKTVGLLHSVGVTTPARASTHAEAEKPKAHGPEVKAPVPAKVEPPAAPAPPPEPPVSDAERAALQDLRARRLQIEARSARLDEREVLVAAAERRLNDRVQQLTALQSKLEQLEKDRQDRQETSWRGLVKTYEDMRPRDAAAIFNDLDSAVLIPVLDRMKDSKAAPILAAMTPERARIATTQLAQARKDANAAPKLDAPDGRTP